MKVVRLVLLALVASSRVGVVMDSRVASKLVRSGELLAAARKLAGMGLFSGVGSDVSSLVFEAVEGLVTQRALIRARELVRVAFGLGTRQWPVGLDNCYGRRRHGCRVDVQDLCNEWDDVLLLQHYCM